MKRILVIAIFLGVVLFIGYEALIYYDNEFKYGRMWETPAVRPHEEPLLIMEAGVVPFSGGEMNFRAKTAEDLTSPLKNDAHETIERGEKVYFTYCAMCHGKNHDGNATVGQSFYPLPTDLRSPKVRSKPDGALFKLISYGAPDSQQPALATTVSVLDRWHVIAYIRSLKTRKPKPKVVEEEPETHEEHEEEHFQSSGQREHTH